MSESKHTPSWEVIRVNPDELWIMHNQNKIASVVAPLSEQESKEANSIRVAIALMEAAVALVEREI